MTDWQAIRHDYEAGLSLRTLSTKYGVPTTTIYRHSQGWNKRNDERNTPFHPELNATEHIAEQAIPEDIDTASLARVAVSQLATIAQRQLELREHKLFADSLSQYHKIIVTDASSATAGQQQQPGLADRELLDYMTQDELDTIMAIYDRARVRKQEKEKDAGITPIRKVQ